METTLGQRIALYRKQKRLTQDSLAELLGISPQAVSKWENDQSSPDTIKLIQLAEVLDTEVEYLATGRITVHDPAPIVLNMVKTEEKIVEVEKIVEKPVIKKITRVKYLRNPIEYAVIGGLCFLAGLILGLIL